MTEERAAPTADDERIDDDRRTRAQLAYVLVFCFGFVAPLAIYLTIGRTDPFVRHHASESLNFQVTYMLVLIPCCVVGVLTVWGLLLLPITFIVMAVLQIRGSIVAGRGQLYHFPFSLRVWPGALPLT